HRTGAALTVVAALFCSGETEIFAECIEQGGPRPEQHAALDAIYTHGHLELWRQAPLGWLVSLLRFSLHCLTPRWRRAVSKLPTLRLVPLAYSILQRPDQLMPPLACNSHDFAKHCRQTVVRVGCLK